MVGSTPHLDWCGHDPRSRVKAPTALYQPAVADAAHQLRYAWTGWPSRGYSLARHSLREWIEQTKPHWERDSLRVREYRGTNDGAQILGRLACAFRSAGLRVPFSRTVAVRCVGENTRRDVEVYRERQVAKEQFVDPPFA